MTRWWPLIAAIVLQGGFVIAVIELLRRRHVRNTEPDLVPRWRAFIERPAEDGEPSIAPAKVPSVKPLQAVKVDRFARFRQRMGCR